MHNNESDLKNMIDAMDSAMASMKLAQQSIKTAITPEMMASLSPLGKTMINKAQELTNMDLKDPEKLLRQQMYILTVRKHKLEEIICLETM